MTVELLQATQNELRPGRRAGNTEDLAETQGLRFTTCGAPRTTGAGTRGPILSGANIRTFVHPQRSNRFRAASRARDQCLT